MPPAGTQTAKIQIAPVMGAGRAGGRAGIGRAGPGPDSDAAYHCDRPTRCERRDSSELDEPIRSARLHRRGAEKTKAKISYIWDVTDQSGKRVHRITGEEVAAGAGKDPWAAVTPQVVQSIADKTATQIASWLPNAVGIPVATNTTPVVGASGTPGEKPAATAATNTAYQTAANTPTPQPLAPTTGSIATSGPITALVPTVTGAPGDGSSALTTAIQRELTKNGVSLSSLPNAQSVQGRGQGRDGHSKDGKQPITIDWSVTDPSGKKLGTVSQKNEVPQGSLDGSWGKTADAAAAAAAQGIVKLLPQPTQRKSSN